MLPPPTEIYRFDEGVGVTPNQDLDSMPLREMLKEFWEHNPIKLFRKLSRHQLKSRKLSYPSIEEVEDMRILLHMKRLAELP